MIDKKAYQKMDYALCLLSAHADGKDSGCIINSFHQVTSSFPAKFTIAVNRENVTAAAVEQAGSFCVTLLAHDAPAALINDFGYRSGRVADKFSPYEVRRDEVGNPYLTDSMVSRVSCRVIDRLEIGSYTLYVGQATEAEVFGSGEVLTLNAYAARGKAVPPTATVYRKWSAAASNAVSAGTSTRAKHYAMTSSVPSAAPRRTSLSDRNKYLEPHCERERSVL